MVALAIPFPDIGPDLVSVDLFGRTFALKYYALAYIAAILLGWRIAVGLVRRPRLWPADTAPMDEGDLEAFLTWIILGVILGGRIGYVLFYEPARFLANPGQIIAVWNGGMAFHGGLLGVVLAILGFSWMHGKRTLSVADMLAVATPPGLFLGRCANFINGELWGGPTLLPWGVIFPGARAQDCPADMLQGGLCARHPSQLYEAAIEGLLLAAVIFFLVFARHWLKRPGAITGVFCLGYGIGRFLVEYVRESDAQFVTPDNPAGNVLALGPVGLSMGQLLSLPLIALGLILLAWAFGAGRRRAAA